MAGRPAPEPSTGRVRMNPVNGESGWPLEKLTALRLGRRLVAEVPAARPDRRGFVDIRPRPHDHDIRARSEGWVRASADRGFRLEHWEYDRERLDGFDYDLGAALVNSAEASDESELTAVLAAWGIRPGLFGYPWEGDDPR